jgi:DNA-3-methyladenine glycosylase II
MFLLFQLGRPDVWPVDDFAVRKGYGIVHRLAEAPKPKELQALGEVYRPYRSVAAWYLWRATDTVLPEE